MKKTASLKCIFTTFFGEEQSASSVKNPWRYASKRVDDESGFIYFGRRYYAPQWGRWITPDPLGFEDGPNLYAYVHNSPLTHFDAYGLESVGNAEEGFGFGWGSMYEGFCDGCSAVANTGYEFGTGMFNGFTSPMDTAGSWINSDLNSVAQPAPSMAKRFGEVCGVVALGVSFYTGGVALATGGWTTGQLFVQGTRMATRRVANDIGRRVVADVVAENAVSAAVECNTPVSTIEVEVASQFVKEGVNATKSGGRKIFKPDSSAQGVHTVFRRDPNTGRVTHYETFRPQTNPRDPKPWESAIRFDNSGKIKQSHFNKVLKKEVFEPHIHDFNVPGGVRPAQLWEIPN